MTTKPIAWSHSRLNTFKDCPRQLWHNIAPRGHPDRVEYVETPAKLAGTEIDDALTARIIKGVPLPAKYQPFEGMAAAVCAAPGHKFGQLQLALDAGFNVCGYRDWDRAWVRSIYDIAVINGPHAWLGDWKNGKVWVDEAQLKLFAAIGFIAFPELEVIDTSYVWLSHGVTSDKSYTRRQLPDLWEYFIPDVERLQIANQTNHWPAHPKRGKATCKWCPANAAGKCKEAQGPYGK